MTSVDLPENITSIEGRTFVYCTNLASIIIPENVTSIGDYAFFACNKLTSITIPDGVTSIGVGAFGSSGLTSLTITENVLSIGGGAFSNCALNSITSDAINPPTIEIGTFAYVNRAISLYVPDGTANTYRSAQYWSEFTNIIEPTPTAIKPVSIIESVYVQNGTVVCAEPSEIYTISGLNVTKQNGNLPSGIYIVKTEKAAQKIVVK